MTALRVVLVGGQTLGCDDLPGTVGQVRDEMAETMTAGATIRLNTAVGTSVVINTRNVLYVEVTG